MPEKPLFYVKTNVKSATSDAFCRETTPTPEEITSLRMTVSMQRTRAEINVRFALKRKEERPFVAGTPQGTVVDMIAKRGTIHAEKSAIYSN